MGSTDHKFAQTLTFLLFSLEALHNIGSINELCISKLQAKWCSRL